jgi:hypothetical protein
MLLADLPSRLPGKSGRYAAKEEHTDIIASFLELSVIQAA